MLDGEKALDPRVLLRGVGSDGPMQDADPAYLRKARAAKEIADAQCCATRSPYEGLRGRIERAVHDGARATERYQAACRLRNLVERNPDFAEFIDLLERI